MVAKKTTLVSEMMGTGNKRGGMRKRSRRRELMERM